MEPYVYRESLSLKEQLDGAYWERNMLALMLAHMLNRQAITEQRRFYGSTIDKYNLPCGYYVHGEWEGWSRVISLNNGEVTFHVPDDFDLGNLPRIDNNWDGHTTEEKWNRVMEKLGLKKTE